MKNRSLLSPYNEAPSFWGWERKHLLQHLQKPILGTVYCFQGSEEGIIHKTVKRGDIW